MSNFTRAAAAAAFLGGAIGFLAFSSNAQANLYDVTGNQVANNHVGIGGVQTYLPGGSVYFDVTGTDVLTFADTVLYSDNPNVDIGDQSPANIEAFVEGYFGVEYQTVAAYDLGGISTYTWTPVLGNVYAFHFGRNEVVLEFNEQLTGGLTFQAFQNLSNLRSFIELEPCEPTDVSEPGTLALLGLGLLGLVRARYTK